MNTLNSNPIKGKIISIDSVLRQKSNGNNYCLCNAEIVVDNTCRVVSASITNPTSKSIEVGQEVTLFPSYVGDKCYLEVSSSKSFTSPEELYALLNPEGNLPF